MSPFLHLFWTQVGMNSSLPFLASCNILWTWSSTISWHRLVIFVGGFIGFILGPEHVTNFFSNCPCATQVALTFFHNYEENFYDQLVALEQGRLSVRKYVESLNELTVRCGVDEGDKQTLSRFWLRLRVEMWWEMATLRFYGVDDIYQMALKIEKELRYSFYRIFNTKVMESGSWKFIDASRTSRPMPFLSS